MSCLSEVRDPPPEGEVSAASAVQCPSPR